MTTQPLSSSDLTALAERTREATKGPWRLAKKPPKIGLTVTLYDFGQKTLGTIHTGSDEYIANAALIAAAPALLATALKQQEENERLRALLEDACQVFAHYDLPEHALHYRRALSPKTGASG